MSNTGDVVLSFTFRKLYKMSSNGTEDDIQLQLLYVQSHVNNLRLLLLKLLKYSKSILSPVIFHLQKTNVFH